MSTRDESDHDGDLRDHDGDPRDHHQPIPAITMGDPRDHDERNTQFITDGEIAADHEEVILARRIVVPASRRS